MSLTLIRALTNKPRIFKQLPSVQKFRYYSSDNENDKKNVLKTAATNKSRTKNVRNRMFVNVFNRFFNYISNYDKVLEKRFPSAMHIYRVFSVGVKDFYGDMKKYIKIYNIVNSAERGFAALTRQEMELYTQMPKDIMRIGPVLLVATLPFANYVVFPLAYMYPRRFLTSHFWSLQQKIEFQELFLKDRTQYNRKIFRHLQSKLDLTEGSIHHRKFNYVLGLLGSGTHPTADDLIEVKSIFTEPPYLLSSLSSSHLKLLCKLHGIHSWYLKQARLSEHCYFMQNQDRAIKLEGGVHNLPVMALRNACYLRGLNPTTLTNDEMVVWLREWMKVSMDIQTDVMSLYLHLPILFTYNHPNNWRLTHK